MIACLRKHSLPLLWIDFCRTAVEVVGLSSSFLVSAGKCWSSSEPFLLWLKFFGTSTCHRLRGMFVRVDFWQFWILVVSDQGEFAVSIGIIGEGLFVGFFRGTWKMQTSTR